MSVKISNRKTLLPVVLLSCAFLASGCAAHSNSRDLSRTAKGTIHLENVSAWSFEADHPTMIDQQTMLNVVKGLIIDEAPTALTKLPANGSKPMRVFSDEDAEFLAPLLAQGLSQAKPEQLIGFRVSPSAGSGAEPTAGTLYVKEGAIHLTITSSKGKSNATGFLPRSAARVEAARPFAAQGAQGARSLVINYSTLAKATVSSVAAASTQEKTIEQDSAALTSDEFLLKKMEELRNAKEIAALKESENSMLRKENNWMKEKLKEQTAQINALKATIVKSAPAPKSNTKPKAELQPTR